MLIQADCLIEYNIIKQENLYNNGQLSKKEKRKHDYIWPEKDVFNTINKGFSYKLLATDMKL